MTIIIREISVSTTGTDREFVELSGAPGTDLGDLTLLRISGSGEVTRAIALSGMVGVNGSYLIASPQTETTFGVTADLPISDNTLSNSSATFLLVRDYTGAVGDNIDPNNDGVIDFVKWSGIVDSVAVIDNDSPVIYSPNVIGPDGTFLAPGGYRGGDGTGPFVMHDFSDFTAYSPTPAQDLLINEISVSTTGSDKEFIELAAQRGMDLSDYSLIGVRSGGEIATVIDIAGSAGEANGRYLIASPQTVAQFGVTPDQTMSDNTLTNASRTYMLVRDFTGSVGQDIDADNDGAIDTTYWSSIADSVAVIDDDSPLIYSGNVVGPDGSFLAPGGYRDPVLSGDFAMHDFADFTAYTPESGSPFVINEISVSTTGTDAEFIEVFGRPGADLSGLSLISLDGSGQVRQQIDLTGDTGDNGFYLMASDAARAIFGLEGDQVIANNSLTNASRTYLLVDGFAGAVGDDLDTDDNGTLDSTPWTTVYDSVAVVDDDLPHVYTQQVIGPDGSFLAAGGKRTLDGYGSWVMHDFFDYSAYTPTQGATTTTLVINEIAVSTTGADAEFIEFYGDAGLSLADYSLLRVQSGGQISRVITLTGTIGDNGYYLLTSPEAVSRLGVIGNQLMDNNTFTNASATFLLVENFTGSLGDDIDVDDDGVIDAASWSKIADSVAVIDDDLPVIYSGNVVGPDGFFLAPGGYRAPEVTGDFVMHDFADFAAYTPMAGTYGAPVVINEIAISTTGTDWEFLEFLGDANVDLSALTLVTLRGDGTVGITIDLEGQTGDNGYYLLASPAAEATFGVTGNMAIANNTFTNASRTYLLVEDFTGAPDDDLDTDDDGILDITPWTSIWDSVAVIDDDLPSVYSNNVVGPDGTFLAPGAYRNPERTGDFVMHEFSDQTLYTPMAGTGDTTGGGGGGGTGATELLISQVQGSGAASSRVGETVVIEAIVVGDFQNGDGDDLRNLGGFYLQEEASDHDADAATSEGIFIFDGSLGVDVALGDRVRVTGTVAEFFGQTQLNATQITVVEAGAVADVNTMAVSVSLDAVSGVVVDGSGSYAPDMEAYEGMLATFTDTLTVNEMFQMDRFNEIRLSANGRPAQFTQLFDPDPVAYDAYQREAGSDQIIFDDGLNVQNAAILPEADLNGDGVFDTADGFTMGDTITGLTGVVTYTWAGNNTSAESWRIRSVDDGNSFVDTAPREDTPPDVGGTLKVASFNVLNFFTTLDVAGNPGSGPSSLPPRGADSASEFERQLNKLLVALTEMDADVYGLVEIENEFGYDQNGDGLVALDFLVDQLNARVGSITYAAVDPGRGFVDTGDAISVGMIYRLDTVALKPNSVEILDDSVVATLSGSYQANLFDGDSTNRAPMAASFVDYRTGEDFTVSVVHMKSKGGAGTGLDADMGDGAGAYNETRTQGVQAVSEWLAGIADEDLVVLGDFNAYAKEDPIDAMLAAGFTNLGETYSPGEVSYVFDGKTGTLDYGFGSAGIMNNVTGAAAWHINSPEADVLDYNLDFGRDATIFDGAVPFRASDHDPLLVGLDFGEGYNMVMGTTRGGLNAGTPGKDWIDLRGGIGDVAMGLGGADVFDFSVNISNGSRDITTLRDFGLDDRIFGMTADDVDVGSFFQMGAVTRFTYGPDHDVVTILGTTPTDLTDFF